MALEINKTSLTCCAESEAFDLVLDLNRHRLRSSLDTIHSLDAFQIRSRREGDDWSVMNQCGTSLAAVRVLAEGHSLHVSAIIPRWSAGDEFRHI